MKHETLTVEFWRERIAEAKRNKRDNPVRDGMACLGRSELEAAANKAKGIIAKYIPEGSSVLDLGCGCGDLYPLMPKDTKYIGIDLVQEFVSEARKNHPTGSFFVRDLCEPSTLGQLPDDMFDIVVGYNVLGTVGYAMGDEAWAAVMKELGRVSKSVMFFSYRHNTPTVYKRVGVLLELVETATP